MSASAWVVLYRNLNLGHRGAPTRVVLEQALVDAGARTARSFQTNGTVLLEADDPHAVVAAAAPMLKDRSGYADAGLIRSLDDLREALGAARLDDHVDERTYRATLTCLDGGTPLPWSLPWTNETDDLDLIAHHAGIVAGVVRMRGKVQGNPTAVLERTTGGVATTRTLGTVQRLLAQFPDQSANG